MENREISNGMNRDIFKEEDIEDLLKTLDHTYNCVNSLFKGDGSLAHFTAQLLCKNIESILDNEVFKKFHKIVIDKKEKE